MNKSLDNPRNRLTRIVTQRLESLERAGVTHLPKARPTASASKSLSANVPRSIAAESAPASEVVSRSLFDAAAPAEAALPPEKRAAALDVIRCEVAACTRCPVLVSNRSQTVFGVGSPTARICFFGEAPGADEDRLGEPFVGRAGQLLNKMIEACKLKRQDVYIMNVLKCRPPDNRNPLPDEVANCRNYFERQLDIIRPEIICCLGAVAAKSLLNTEVGIGKLRGRIHDYRGIPVVCSYHPAYLLRNPAAKHDAWEDLKMMMRKLGVIL
jgi:uracil-DNA glycosylase